MYKYLKEKGVEFRGMFEKYGERLEFQQTSKQNYTNEMKFKTERYLH